MDSDTAVVTVWRMGCGCAWCVRGEMLFSCSAVRMVRTCWGSKELLSCQRCATYC